MRTRLRGRRLSVVFAAALGALLIAATIGGCSGWSGAQSTVVGGYTVLFRTQPSPPKVGQTAELAVKISDDQGRPVRTCRVMARQSMPDMEMSTDDDLIELGRQGNGVYSGRSHEFSMGGDWRIDVTFDCTGKPLEAKFEFNLPWPE